jgi:hypothetical protein
MLRLLRWLEECEHVIGCLSEVVSVVDLGKGTRVGNHSTVRASRMLAVLGM